MKHIKDMSRDEILAAMIPSVRRDFNSLSAEAQDDFLEEIAAAQDRLHDDAVAESWFRQGLFYR